MSIRLQRDSRFNDNVWVECKIDTAELANSFWSLYKEYAGLDSKTSFIFRDCPLLAQACGATRMSAEDSNTEIWLLKGTNATCPELCDGKIESAQARIFCQKYGEWYAIYVHDKTKNFATALGGTANEDEYKIAGDLARAEKIVMRKVCEESGGLKDLKLRPFAKLHFNSTYYGLAVPDVCWQFTCECKDESFMDLIFHDTNKRENGVFVWQCGENFNDDTNWMSAIPLRLIQDSAKYDAPVFKIDFITVGKLQMSLDLMAFTALESKDEFALSDVSNKLVCQLWELNNMPKSMLPSSFVNCEIWICFKLLPRQQPDEKQQKPENAESGRRLSKNGFTGRLRWLGLGGVICAALAWQFPVLRAPLAFIGGGVIGGSIVAYCVMFGIAIVIVGGLNFFLNMFFHGK